MIERGESSTRRGRLRIVACVGWGVVAILWFAWLVSAVTPLRYCSDKWDFCLQGGQVFATYHAINWKAIQVPFLYGWERDRRRYAGFYSSVWNRSLPNAGAQLGLVLPGWQQISFNPSVTAHTLALPIWILVLPTALVTFLLWQNSRPVPLGHCQRCGYDLTGNVSGRCSECGHVIRG